MALPNRYTGKDLFVSFAGIAITGDQRSFSVKEASEMVEAQAGSETDKAYIARLNDGDASIEILATGTAGTAIRAVLVKGTGGTLLYGGLGSATGNPKGGFYAIIKDSEESFPYAEVVMFKASFQKSGTLLFQHGTAVW